MELFSFRTFNHHFSLIILRDDTVPESLFFVNPGYIVHTRTINEIVSDLSSYKNNLQISFLWPSLQIFHFPCRALWRVFWFFYQFFSTRNRESSRSFGRDLLIDRRGTTMGFLLTTFLCNVIDQKNCTVDEHIENLLDRIDQSSY